MKDSDWHLVQGTLISSAPVKAYGGISFSSQVLHDAAQHLNATPVPWHVDHKLSRPIRVRGFTAFVERRDDGVDLLKFRAEIHQDDKHWLEFRSGLSLTIMAPLARGEEEAFDEATTIRISADHAWFSDDALIDAKDHLITLGFDQRLIRVERAYQFSFMPDPQIFIEGTFQVLQSIGSSAIWEGIKRAFGKRKTPAGGTAETQTSINISATDGARSISAVVTTNDEAVAQRAMDSLDQSLTAFFGDSPTSILEGKSKAVTVWDDQTHRWTPPN